MSGSRAILVVGGSAWTNWASYEVESDFFTPADSWQVEVRAPSVEQLAQVQPGAKVAVLIDELPALQGYLERRFIRREAAGTLLTLAGRDLAAPLVDCTPGPSWRFSGMSLEAVAQKALTELGVLARISAGPAAKVARSIVGELGETYWACLERYAKLAGLFVWMDPDGTLNIGRPDTTGQPVATIGERVLSAEMETTWNGRFSEITVLGQATGRSPEWTGTGEALSGESCSFSITARDPEITDHRPLFLDIGGMDGTGDAKARATHEVNQRAFQASRLAYVIPGHGPKTGSLWAPNQRVHVVDPANNIDAIWWVQSRRLTYNAEGARTHLTLRDSTLLSVA
ncbi:MAG TPA: hypothetical protein PLA94_02685 [Myxococcota bacterium]|nr:hypothetical protein [Myxococcota bacterium]